MHQHPESYADQFEKTSGLTEWLGWLLIMLIIAAVLSLGMYFKNRQIIEYGMYAIITTLGIGLIIKGYFDAKFIDREMKLASKQITILEHVENLESFFEHALPSVFRSHIDNLYTISQSQTEISQDNLIEVLHSRLMAKNKVVELFASVLITLGLIGTIIGLILMMHDLVFTMNSIGGETDKIISKLFNEETGALSGLGIAFITTLLGAVLGGVVLRVLTGVIDANISKYIAHLAELTEVHVLPHMRMIARDTKDNSQHVEHQKPKSA